MPRCGKSSKRPAPLPPVRLVSVKRISTSVRARTVESNGDIPPLNGTNFSLVDGYEMRSTQNDISRLLVDRLLDQSKPDVVSLNAPCGSGKTVVASKSMTVFSQAAQASNQTRGRSLFVFLNANGGFELKQAREINAFQNTGFISSNPSHVGALRREFNNNDSAVIAMNTRSFFSMLNGVRSADGVKLYNMDAIDFADEAQIRGNLKDGKLPALESFVAEFKIKNVVLFIDEVQFILAQASKNLVRLLCNQKTLSQVPWNPNPFNLFVLTTSATPGDMGRCPSQIFETNRASLFSLKIASNTVDPDTAEALEAAVTVSPSAENNAVAANSYDFMRGSDAKFQISCGRARKMAIQNPADSSTLMESSSVVLYNALMASDSTSPGSESTRGIYSVENRPYKYIVFNSRIPAARRDFKDDSIYLSQKICADLQKDDANDIDCASFLFGRISTDVVELNNINLCNPQKVEMRKIVSGGRSPKTVVVNHFHCLLLGVECHPLAKLLRTKAAIEAINSDRNSKSVIFDMTNDSAATRELRMTTEVARAIELNMQQVVILLRASAVVGSEVYSENPTVACYIGDNGQSRKQFYNRLGRVLPKVGLVIPSIEQGYLHFSLVSSFGALLIPDSNGCPANVSRADPPHSTFFEWLKDYEGGSKTAHRFARSCFKLGRTGETARPLDKLIPMRFKTAATTLTDEFRKMCVHRNRNSALWKSSFQSHLEYLSDTREYANVCEDEDCVM